MAALQAVIHQARRLVQVFLIRAPSGLLHPGGCLQEGLMRNCLQMLSCKQDVKKGGWVSALGCKQVGLLEWGLASAPSTPPQSSWPGLAGWGLGRSGPTAKGGEHHRGWVSINKSNNVGRTFTINRETGASQYCYPSPKAFSLTP